MGKTRAEAAAEATEEQARLKQEEIDAALTAASEAKDAERLAQYYGEEPEKKDSATWAAFLEDFGFNALTRGSALERIAEAPTNWLVQGLVSSGTYGVLAGDKGIGKTWALLDLAVSVALGEPWLGRFDTASRRALVLACEDTEAETWRRADAIAVSRGRDPEELDGRLFVHPEPVNMTDRATLDILEEEVQRFERDGYGLIVLDPAYKYLAGADPANLFAMGKVLTPLQKIAAGAGAALIVGHHFNRKRDARRSDRLTGAGLLEWGRLIVTLDGPPPVPGETSRVITVEASGNSIADVALSIRRKIARQGEDADSAYDYAVEVLAEGAAAYASAGSSAATRIHAVMAEDRSARWTLDEVVEAVNADGGPALKKATISSALRKQLKGVVLTDSVVGRSGGRWWLPETATFGENAVIEHA